MFPDSIISNEEILRYKDLDVSTLNWRLCQTVVVSVASRTFISQNLFITEYCFQTQVVFIQLLLNSDLNLLI